MSTDNILTCVGGTLVTDSSGAPICSGGNWLLDGNSAWWVALSSEDVAVLLGKIALVFATVYCVKMALRVIQNR